MTATKRWRGLRALVGDAVEHGSLAIERIQKETARGPFEVLESIPGIAEPARGVHAIHDASISAAHAGVRLANRLVGKALDLAIEAIGRRARHGA